MERAMNSPMCRMSQWPFGVSRVLLKSVGVMFHAAADGNGRVLHLL